MNFAKGGVDLPSILVANSYVIYYCGPLLIDEQMWDDQQEPICKRSEPIQDVALKICREPWTTGKGGRKEPDRSVLATQYDDDDDDDIYIYIYILQQFKIVTISLDVYMVNQMWYNLESTQYLSLS